MDQKTMDQMTNAKRLAPLLAALFLLPGCGNQTPPSGQSYPEPESKGAQLLLEKCSACHGAPLPSSHVASVWPSVLERMQMRMTTKGQQALRPDEIGVLLDYLQRHAGTTEK